MRKDKDRVLGVCQFITWGMAAFEFRSPYFLSLTILLLLLLVLSFSPFNKTSFSLINLSSSETQHVPLNSTHLNTSTQYVSPSQPQPPPLPSPPTSIVADHVKVSIFDFSVIFLFQGFWFTGGWCFSFIAFVFLCFTFLCMIYLAEKKQYKQDWGTIGQSKSSYSQSSSYKELYIW